MYEIILAKTRYCWHHYPKREPCLFLVTGTVIGVILSLLLTYPLRIFLSQFWPLYYLDTYQPRLMLLEPDVRRGEDPNTSCRLFRATFIEMGSGLDLSSSILKIRTANSSLPVILNGSCKKTDNSITFELSEELAYGQYELEIICLDRAGNRFELVEPFEVSDKSPLTFTVSRAPYGDSPSRDSFSSPRSLDFSKFHCLYVYRLGVINNRRNVELSNIHATVVAPEPVYQWVEEISRNTRGSDAVPSGKLSEGAFSNVQVVTIERIGPQGGIHFAFLAGHESESLLETRHLEIVGTYYIEAYGTKEQHDVEEQFLLLK